MIRTYLMSRKELEAVHYKEEWLTPARRETIAKLKREDSRQLSACAGILLIYALRSLDPDVKLPLKIHTEELGKPILDTLVLGKPMHFNLSHSKNYAACTISDAGPVGVDVESFRVKEYPLMDKILHPDEAGLLPFITDVNEKNRYFYQCWVTKESYLKQTGKGLTIRPQKFMINEDTFVTEEKDLPQRYVHVYTEEEIENVDWKFSNGYQLAVCSEKKDPDSRAMVVSADEINCILK